jgi:sugar phosphate isomerase/epimerase
LPLSRRDLLILLPAFAFAKRVQEPRLQFPRTPRERLAVTSWPFRAYMDSPTNHGRKASVRGMDLKEFPAFVARKFGVHAINPLADHFHSTDDAYLGELREAVDKAGSHVVDLGLGGGDFYDPDAAARQSAADYGRKWIDIAVKIGSPSVRLHLRIRPNQKPDPELAAQSLGSLAGYGAKRNVVVNLENDNAIAEDPFLLVTIIEKVNSPYLRALPDFGNSLIGHDENYNQRAVKAMLAHAWNMCHVKDVVKGEDGEMKRVDLKKMFGLAKQSAYVGYYSMEFDTDAGDPIAGTQKLVQESLEYLG